jgi:hypothetical protein
MAVPNYTYLKLKMSGPHGVIIVSSSFQHAYECEVECVELATATITSAEFTDTKKGVIEDRPDAKRSTGSLEPTEDTKTV